MILRSSLDKYTGIKLKYVRELVRLIQSEVLGTTTSPSNWKLRWTKTTNEPIAIDNIQVRNQVGRAMLKWIDIIIDAAIPTDEMKTKLILVIAKCTEGMTMLTLHQALLQEEKEKFKDLMGDFFELWIELFSDKGLSNYLYLLGSGHILNFLNKYNCLYM